MSCSALIIHPGVVVLPRMLALIPIMLFANGVAILAPVVRLVLSEFAWIMSPALLAGAVAALLLPKELIGEVYVGYKLWVASLFGLAIYWSTGLRGQFREYDWSLTRFDPPPRQFTLRALSGLIVVFAVAMRAVWVATDGDVLALSICLVGAAIILLVPGAAEDWGQCPA